MRAWNQPLPYVGCQPSTECVDAPGPQLLAEEEFQGVPLTEALVSTVTGSGACSNAIQRGRGREMSRKPNETRLSFGTKHLVAPIQET